MFTIQGLHAIEVAVVQFAQVHLVHIIMARNFQGPKFPRLADIHTQQALLNGTLLNFFTGTQGSRKVMPSSVSRRTPLPR